MSAKKPPKVELTIPILQDMELAATNTAEVVAKHMGLSEEKTAEISMALIEATINALNIARVNPQMSKYILLFKETH